MAALREEGFTLVVSLLTPAENVELRLQTEAAQCIAQGLEFRSYPIPDRTTPINRRGFDLFASEILGHIREGGKGFFHCRAGLGRAPLLGCVLLVKTGIPAEQAWKLLEESRGQPVPDTKEQRRWVQSSGPGLSLDEALGHLQQEDGS